MKIAIDGSQSTGKTTLLERTKKYFDNTHNLNFIEEMAGVVASSDMNVKTPEDWNLLLNDSEKYKLFVSVLIEKQKKEELNIPFISDSSLYRIYAYAIENGLEVSQKDLEMINYDLIFYCPIEFEFINNNFRTEHFRESIDKKLTELINKYHKGKIVTLRGSIENRQKKINETIEELLLK